MQIRPKSAVLFVIGYLLFTVLVFTTPADAAPKGRLLFSFNGYDGLNPSGPLAFDSAGNLYGTTPQGGKGCRNQLGCGLVYQLSPSGTGWSQKILYEFTNGNDGVSPQGGVVVDPSGNLYGVANYGPNGCGLVYQLVPGSDGTWSETTVHQFTGEPDGCVLNSGLTLDVNANLYGITFEGGPCCNQGTVYELTPISGGGWSEAILYSFGQEGIGGGNPEGPLVFDSTGSLYGTTNVGGVYGVGTVFKLTRASGQWTQTVLYNFTGGYEGSTPQAGVAFDEHGNLYGTTPVGGWNNHGIAYQLTPAPVFWNFSVIHDFSGNEDGGLPTAAPLSIDSDGNILGTTNLGGTYEAGTIYALTPQPNNIWYQTVLHSFSNDIDGGHPQAGASLDSSGNLYTTTTQGGAHGAGNVVEMPRAPR